MPADGLSPIRYPRLRERSFDGLAASCGGAILSLADEGIE